MFQKNNKNFSDWKFFSFATGGGAPWAANISAILEKIQNALKGILMGMGETVSWKKPEKPEVENLVALSL